MKTPMPLKGVPHYFRKDEGQDTVKYGKRGPEGWGPRVGNISTEFKNRGPSPSDTDMRDDTHLSEDVGKEYAGKGRVLGPPEGDDTYGSSKPMGTHYNKRGK